MRSIYPLLLIAVMLISSYSHAGVVLVSRESLIAAEGQTSEDSFNVSDAHNSVGPFSSSVGDSIDVPSGGATSASASQLSDLTVLPDSLSGSASGTVAAQVAEFDAIAASADSQYVVIFDVINQSETINLAGSANATFDATSRVILDDNGSTTFFHLVIDFGEENQRNFDQSLTLPIGRYRLIASATANGTPTPNSGDFQVSYNFNGATVIPLPPAVWPGAVMLLGVVLRAIRPAGSA